MRKFGNVQAQCDCIEQNAALYIATNLRRFGKRSLRAERAMTVALSHAQVEAMFKPRTIASNSCAEFSFSVPADCCFTVPADFCFSKRNETLPKFFGRLSLHFSAE